MTTRPSQSQAVTMYPSLTRHDYREWIADCKMVTERDSAAGMRVSDRRNDRDWVRAPNETVPIREDGQK
jgi:hypothetical protein